MSRRIPQMTEIEVSSRCQLRCLGCPINEQSGAGEFMDFALFKSIVDRIDFKTTIVILMNGEPLLHPRYAEMVRYVTDREHRCYISTNGMIWNEELFEHITGRTSCYQIIFSFDGLPWTNSPELARPGTDKAKVLETIERFGQLKLSKDTNLDMAVKLCQRGQDWQEVEDYIGYWLEKPYVDFVAYGRMLSENCAPGQRVYPCRYFDDNFLLLRTDGSARLCAYNSRIVNGNENPVGTPGPDENLLDFYNSEVYMKYREDQNRGIFHGPCTTCGYAFTGSGFRGEVQFRSSRWSHLGKIHYRQDYYNQLYSLKDKGKPDSVYE